MRVVGQIHGFLTYPVGMPTVSIIDRRVALSPNVYRSSRALRAPGLEVQVVDCAGCVTDTSRLDEAMGAVDLKGRTLTVVLEGTYESDDQRAGPGAMVVERRHRWRERWTGKRQRFVTLMWEDGPVFAGGERLSAVAMDRWAQVADAIQGASAQSADRVATAALRLASEAGVSLSLPEAPIPREVHRVQSGLNAMFTQLHESPQAIDLERHTGLSARHLRRIFRSHPTLLPQSLRRSLHFLRLISADTLMRSTDRSIAEIARALGYRSDRALHTAIRRSGLRT